MHRKFLWQFAHCFFIRFGLSKDSVLHKQERCDSKDRREKLDYFSQGFLLLRQRNKPGSVSLLAGSIPDQSASRPRSSQTHLSDSPFTRDEFESRNTAPLVAAHSAE